MSTPARQRGVALLVALLVVALAVILIAALLDRGELAFARTRNALRTEQADAYAQGLDLYAARILFSLIGQGADTNSSAWAMPLPSQPVPGGRISATMRDLNGCFNLNNLSSGNPDSAKWLPVFRSLLTNLGVDPNLAGTVQSWLGNGNDNDANYYLALAVPYRPRHDLFAHVSELRLLDGVSGDVYARLAPHVCALPSGTSINLNTASVPLLQSIAPQLISAAVAQSLWNEGHANFTSVTDFATQAHLADPALLPSTMYGVESQYFLLRGEIVLDDVPSTYYSLIERRQGGAGGGIRVLARSRGSDEALVVAAPIAGRRPGSATLD